jgi:hypothetical protein
VARSLLVLRLWLITAGTSPFRPPRRGTAACAWKSLANLPHLGFVKKAIAIGVEAVKPLLEEFRRLILGELTIVVGIRRLESLSHGFGTLPAWSALGWAGRIGSGARATFAWTGHHNHGTTLGAESFFWSQLAVAISIKLEKCSASSDDFARGKLAVMIGIERCK